MTSKIKNEYGDENFKIYYNKNLSDKPEFSKPIGGIPMTIFLGSLELKPTFRLTLM